MHGICFDIMTILNKVLVACPQPILKQSNFVPLLAVKVAPPIKSVSQKDAVEKMSQKYDSKSM